MVVKEKRGRRRYIVFTVPGNITKTALINMMNDTADRPYVIQCGQGYAIIRCSPDEREDVIAVVEGSVPGSSSLLTSGTLKALRRRMPELERIR